ncbi:MAG: hypothetical protein P9M11_00615 [Candidatus Tenebribacter burtonii]|jgi:Ca2+/Na+ antiporter|nr:hypothetical protein [Candidatus Tenebribacter burtonii]
MNKILNGEEPKEEELFYKEWGWETLRENIKIQNDIFKLFITLETIIITTFLGFYLIIDIHVCVKNIIFTLLTLSLISSIIGIYPFAMKVNLNNPDKIKSYKSKRMKTKELLLKLSFLLLFAGFFTFFFAILYSL